MSENKPDKGKFKRYVYPIAAGGVMMFGAAIIVKLTGMNQWKIFEDLGQSPNKSGAEDLCDEGAVNLENDDADLCEGMEWEAGYDEPSEGVSGEFESDAFSIADIDWDTALNFGAAGALAISALALLLYVTRAKPEAPENRAAETAAPTAGR